MKKIAFLFFQFLLLCLVSVSVAQTNKTMFIGHSLVNFDVPNMVNKLSIAASKPFSYHASIGIGAPLLYQWDNPNSPQGSPWKTTLPQGGFEHMIVTEAVPLLNHTTWSKTYRIVDSLYRFARQYNPNIKYYLYETWHCTNTGTPTGCDWDNDDALLWRPRLTADLPKWETIADSLNAIHPNAMLVIPVGQAMARLVDQIALNNVPGITSVFQLFSDNIHLTDVGNYFVACVMYSVIHKTSPVGLPNQLTNQWETPYASVPTPSQALAFQTIAWETVCNYARDGASCSPTLAVTNVGFTADVIDNKHVEIRWQTESEINNEYFEVERSVDGQAWNKIQTIKGSGTKSTRTNYRTIDQNPFQGNNYYRIKQVDTDGSFSYGGIAKAHVFSQTPINIYPNPSQGEFILEGASASDFRLFNLDGKEITKLVDTEQQGANVKLNLHKMDNGVYILKLGREARRVILQK